jgi:hypothetical protein
MQMAELVLGQYVTPNIVKYKHVSRDRGNRTVEEDRGSFSLFGQFYHISQFQRSYRLRIRILQEHKKELDEKDPLIYVFRSVEVAEPSASDDDESPLTSDVDETPSDFDFDKPLPRPHGPPFYNYRTTAPKRGAMLRGVLNELKAAMEDSW